MTAWSVCAKGHCHDSEEDREACERPSCVACGDWDETVAQVPVTRRTQALLCASCAASDEVVRTLAAEDGLDEVDE